MHVFFAVLQCANLMFNRFRFRTNTSSNKAVKILQFKTYWDVAVHVVTALLANSSTSSSVIRRSPQSCVYGSMR